MNAGVCHRGTEAQSEFAKSLTHKQAVRRVGNWLKNTKGCGIVATELATANHETPDAIGFYGHGGSILVECKVSRSDFLADAHKSFRREAYLGMGDLRYFAAPPGVFRDIADDFGCWGVLEIREHQIKILREAKPQPANKTAEVKFLMSILRRLEISTAVFVREEEASTTAEVGNIQH
jgi:hypothetical protein